MNTTNSATLRDYMSSRGYISEIYHFKEAPLFEGVCASFIVFRYIKTLEKRKTIDLYRYIKTGLPEYSELNSRCCFQKVEIPQFEVHRRWFLATKTQQDFLLAFEQHCMNSTNDLFSTPVVNRIGDFCDIGNGMVSGLDKAFNVTMITDINQEEQNSCIKVLKAKDLGYYNWTSESKYFFLRKKISEDEFKNTYPNIFSHILPFKDELNERYDYGKGTPYWEFVFPRNFNLFSREKPRIMVPCKERISNKNHFRFVLAPKDCFPLQDVTAILKKDCCKESIEYLTAYLNNSRVFEWLCFNGIVKGYIVEFSEAPISSIPYRIIDWQNPLEVKAHNLITDCVRRYQETKSQEYLNKINEQFNELFS